MSSNLDFSITNLKNQLLNTPQYPEDKTLIPAAVLLAVFLEKERPSIIFTQRTQSVKTHKGQISLPGGAIEAKDATPASAALREAHEEIALCPSDVNVIGYLESIETITGYWVIPTVGIVTRKPALCPCQEEVEKIFTVKIQHLLMALKKNELLQKEQKYSFNSDHGIIWGVTWKIVHNFLTLL